MVKLNAPDAPCFVRNRRYPFPISKTAIVAAGTKQNWPQFLAAFTWVIELINVRTR